MCQSGETHLLLPCTTLALTIDSNRTIPDSRIQIFLRHLIFLIYTNTIFLAVMYLLCLFFYQHTIHKFSFIVKDRWNETGFAFNYGYHDIQYNDDFKRETIDRGLHVIIEIYRNRFCFYRFLYRELFYVLPPLKPTPQHTPPLPNTSDLSKLFRRASSLFYKFEMLQGEYP